eukprot:CAMPEP_0181230278 /NCGR_PEP_ID=MMETSP1096-20121128/34383_1 /TAXON_ID=156174 ORGANISM="Chrysochromulina ericina, Strain CCMP281" /NCGR_SAMPLE_ID=MMETSP1096 /ASSEMBLY_ACC=CAM_ASM_000453 /LENGTH=111 /DNA_ID=CAMNT_0023324033 /DNA_START=333 /DNA_END=667 /DNA_ORIENTATION=-
MTHESAYGGNTRVDTCRLNCTCVAYPFSASACSCWSVAVLTSAHRGRGSSCVLLKAGVLQPAPHPVGFECPSRDEAECLAGIEHVTCQLALPDCVNAHTTQVVPLEIDVLL